VVLANAVQHVGQSVKIWLAAADLEHDSAAKKRVLRKGKASDSAGLRISTDSFYSALEHIPNSVRLWKETVNLESSATDARILLSRAVEVIPLSVELWLALARLEVPERAKAVLNKARKAVPTSHEIWIAAGRLLEQEAGLSTKSPAERAKELDVVDKTIEAGVRGLRRHQVLLTREQWLKEAERCESEGSPRTCEAIVKATVAMELEDEDRLDTWVGDAESAEAKGMVSTSRAILSYALKVYPDRRNLWRKAADLEKTHGTRFVYFLRIFISLLTSFVKRESLDAILNLAVVHCPQAEVLWLMAAKEKWLSGDVPAAREVLERAFVANPESEQIWLAAVKLEAENGELEVARELLIRARTVADTQRASLFCHVYVHFAYTFTFQRYG
jgi:pre-mRNA-processing factor 6